MPELYTIRKIRHLALGTAIAVLLSLGLCVFADESVSAMFTIDTRGSRHGGNSTFDWTVAVANMSNGFIGDTGGYLCDFDGDGIPDWWELQFSRTGSKISFVAEADDDGDGVMNLYEFVAGTDPTNETSVLKATISFDDDGSPIIGWEPKLSEAETRKRSYKKFGKVRLKDDDWTPIDDDNAADFNFFKVSVEMK